MNFSIHFQNQFKITIPWYEQPDLLISLDLDDEETCEKILRKDDSLFELLKILINNKRILKLLKIYNYYDIESVINTYDFMYAYSNSHISCSKIEHAQTLLYDAEEVSQSFLANNTQRNNAFLVIEIAKELIKKKEQSLLKKQLTRKRRSDFQINRDRLFLLLIEQNESKCVKCNSIDKLSVDHIVPISKGGSDEISNLQILCIRCNSSKGDR